uniref:Oleosin Ara h 14.0102 n=1 Tax=Arachis hypogaea TaxID=3818 RepID=OL142_ARAHY|nr:RecName: Full=Oleosin Ara h 14.0102; AltName: Full=Oleosin 5 variant B; AltName: Allergen=Ara h 14.0102 [Arachis hypogaea]AAK13450.1 oleosin variant B [Arachis hypogaea]
MATATDRAPHQVQVHTPTTQRVDVQRRGYDVSGGGVKTFLPDRGPSTSQIIAVLVGVPTGGTLLLLSGLSLLGTIIGLAIATPVFTFFSPVIVPAVVTIGLAVIGILTAGACGLTGLMSLSWMINFIRQVHGTTVPDQLDSAKRRMADMADYVGQKTKDAGQEIQTKAQDVKRSSS